MTVHRYRQINDVHLSDQPPAGRTASYLDDILAKLEWAVTVPLITDGIVITGDLFHRKNAAHTTHRTVQRVREVLTAHASCPTYIVPGNHDEAHGGGLVGQPLLSVVEDALIHLLVGRPSIDLDQNIAGVPWSNAFEGEDGVAAFALACDVVRPLIFAHAPISDRPFPFGPEARGWMLDTDVIAALPDSVRFVGHGHMHGQQIPVYSRAVLSNPGALSRASLSADDVARAPMVADIEYDDITGAVTVQYVEVPHRPASEVLRIAEHARATHRDGSVEALAAHLGSADTEVVDAETMRAHLRGLVRPETIAPDVWDRGMKMADAALDGVSA